MLQCGVASGRYGKTRKEALDKLQVLIAQNTQGIPVADKNWKGGEYLDYWLAEVVKPNRRPSTYAQCEQIARLYLKPGLGHYRLQALSVPMVQGYVNHLLEQGHSVSKVHIIRKILSAALTRAMREEVLTRNVAHLVELKGIQSREVVPWSSDEVTRFLAAARDHMWHVAFLVILLYGLRRGEVLGLRWKDVDLERGELHIRQQLLRVGRELVIGPVKTRAGRRDLPLLQGVVDALGAHHAKLGRAVSSDDLIFTTSVGTPIEPRNFVRAFQIICKNNDLRLVTIHDLRHSQATLLMELGVPARVAQLILGHSHVSVTQQIYQHGSMEQKREALQGLAAILENTKTAQVEGPELLTAETDGSGSRQTNRQGLTLIERVMMNSLWSHRRGLNPRPHPYHGCALPTELRRHWRLF